tara:strand:+ start:10 stop:846 length:837 start_codon:yes stop_codon:yes gene_type:complete
MNIEKGLERGVLYIVATPIGNNDDMSSRAREILIACDRVAAEDTRRAARLLAKLGGNRHKLISLHEHNEDKLVDYVVGELVKGASVALVSDSGTPLLSDPGYRLVKAASSSGISVRPIPGPSSIIAALSVCPLPAHPFSFVGFLPKKKKELHGRLKDLIKKREAVVFFESPRRIRRTLSLLSTLTDRKIFLIKEMTKTFEDSWSGSASELLFQLDQDPKGEFVGVLEKVELSENTTLDAEAFLKEMLKHLPPAKASSIAAKVLPGKRQDYYEMALSLL